MSEVRVRMYRQGLGDCFLLRFTDGGGVTRHVLVDCGALKGTPDVTNRMRAVANDIVAETGGHLDVLVATHEHWDHLSGFLQAQELFDGITVDEIWLAWTEDPDDDLANELRDHRARARAAVATAARALGAAGTETATRTAARIDAVLAFEGDLAAGATATTGAALDWIKARPGAQPQLLRPGELAPDSISGVTVYVLGPPHDRAKIKRSDPSRRDPEVYELGGGMGLDAGFCAAAAALDAGERPDTQPFDAFFAVPTAEATASEFFEDRYLGRRDAWRRIDHDWLGLAGSLALQLDSDTNNTSLVLAFELGAGGPVLLFPGDAQVGNWLSWDDYTWETGAGADATARTVTAADLLERTVLYKVGHHGSHNATLRAQGLERMTSPDLVAMIPVNRATAAKMRWKMPFDPLLDRLMEKTQQRVLDAERGILGKGSGTRWDAFQARTQVAKWSVDYTVEW